MRNFQQNLTKLEAADTQGTLFLFLFGDFRKSNKSVFNWGVLSLVIISVMLAGQAIIRELYDYL